MYLNRCLPKRNINSTLPLMYSAVLHHPNFYGSDDDLRTNDPDAVLEGKSTALYQPALPVRNGWVRVGDAVQTKDELVHHYRDVLRLVEMYGHTMQTAQHYFWCRPSIVSREATVASFPWYDTWPEMTKLFIALTRSDQGEIYFDRYQGWQLILHRQNDDLYVVETNPDEEPEEIYTCVAVPNSMVTTAVTEAQQTTRLLLQHLVTTLGINPWQYAW